MREKTIHRVDGVGKQRAPDESQPFDPRVFEQAIHGLQKLILDAVRFKEYERRDDEYDPDHELGEQDNTPVIHVQEETVLWEACRLVPTREWDVSILVDQQFDNSYALRTSVDCGGDILVYATLFVQDGMLRRFDVGHTCIHDPEESMEVTSLSIHTSSREVMHLNRGLERAVERGYAATIDSAAKAFDYLGTKTDIPPSGERLTRVQGERMSVYQKDWATIRGKSKQTVSDNVRAAQDQLHELPDSPAFDERRPALEQLDPDGEEPGDIRLV